MLYFVRVRRFHGQRDLDNHGNSGPLHLHNGFEHLAVVVRDYLPGGARPGALPLGPHHHLLHYSTVLGDLGSHCRPLHDVLYQGRRACSCSAGEGTVFVLRGFVGQPGHLHDGK